MKIDQNYLHEKYYATSTDDGNGDIESYEAWLERQLISRLKRLEEFDPETKDNKLEKLIERYENRCYKGKHDWRFICSSDGTLGKDMVHICTNCGTFEVFAQKEGVSFKKRFTLHTKESIEAAGNFLQIAEAADASK